MHVTDGYLYTSVHTKWQLGLSCPGVSSEQHWLLQKMLGFGLSLIAKNWSIML